jgi:hypothetical protein
MKECCICGAYIAIGHDALCREHWEEYKEHLDEPWLKYLIAHEHRERRYRRKTVNYISLEDTIGQD